MVFVLPLAMKQQPRLITIITKNEQSECICIVLWWLICFQREKKHKNGRQNTKKTTTRTKENKTKISCVVCVCMSLLCPYLTFCWLQKYYNVTFILPLPETNCG